MQDRILVLGLGNPLMGDDGIGLAVAQALKSQTLPDGVRAETASDILHLPSLWKLEPQLWLVDAVQRNAPPGTVHELTHEEVLGLSGAQSSAHHLNLSEGLRWLTHTYPETAATRVRLWGIEPEVLEAVQGLSKSVESAVAVLVSRILRAAEDLLR